MDKWRAVREGELCGDKDIAKKRAQAVEEWRLQQIKSYVVALLAARYWEMCVCRCVPSIQRVLGIVHVAVVLQWRKSWQPKFLAGSVVRYFMRRDGRW